MLSDYSSYLFYFIFCTYQLHKSKIINPHEMFALSDPTEAIKVQHGRTLKLFIVFFSLNFLCFCLKLAQFDSII